MTTTLETSTSSPCGKSNDDEGGGGGGGDRLEANQTQATADAEQPQTNEQPASPSIRQQVTSVIMNMRNKLATTSQDIVQQLQLQQLQHLQYHQHNQNHHHHHHHHSNTTSPHHHAHTHHRLAQDDEEDEESEDDDDEEEEVEEDEHYEQAVDIFVKHLDQQELERERQRRASLPTDEIELTTLSGVVLRRKQQLQLRYQQQKSGNSSSVSPSESQESDSSTPQQQQQQSQQQHLMPPKARPLSISSISSAASSNSSSSSSSSSSSGIQSSLTRNSSLNYSQEFRKQSYLASIESLDGSGVGTPQMTASSSSNCVDATASCSSASGNTTTTTTTGGRPADPKSIEGALKSLNLSDQFKDLAATRAAVLAAGESQRRGFGTPGNRISRINRSLHASLRYDKNTAYRIHLLANARNLMNSNNGKVGAGPINRGQQANPVDADELRFRRYSSISRNNSSTSSDSGNPRQSFRDVHLQKLTCTCRTRVEQSQQQPNATGQASTSTGEHGQNTSAQLDENQQEGPSQTSVKQKAASLDSASRQRGAPSSQVGQHHPDCSYSKRPRRASNKLQQSPSSVSSHSNNSSLFRDDGFEDDLTSTASEHSSTIFHSSHKRHAHNHAQHHDHHRQLFYHQNQNHQLSYNRGHLQEAGLGLLTIAQRVVTEIIETERSYVDDLEQIVTGYLCYLRDVLEQHKELFSNLEDIHKFNKDFLFQLEECYLNPGAVAACFVENAAKFDVYTHYCTMYPEVVSTLTQLMADPTTAQVLKERQLELNQSLPLGAYLLKPVQRILKYHILFKSLIKHTADDETVADKDRELINEAFSVMTNIACHINEMKKKHEHSIRVQELQSLLCGWEGPDLTTLGELILEDNFKLYNRQKSSRHLLLFDNVLLITKKKRDGSLCYKGHIACSNLMLIETIEGQPLVFNTVPFDNPKALCAFQADNLDKKRDWCLQMKEVIIKSFEVKIPVHVRDLLMSLTKSSSGGANEPGAPNKSTTSDGSASKTCIHAPKYLEKKRIRQEKKKQ